MAAGILTLTGATFAETVNGADKPVFVDFWAEWCGPCKQIAPILEQIATEMGDRVTIAKVNVDEHPELAGQFSVMSIPTLLLFRNGELVHKVVGAKSKSALVAELDPFLPASR